MSTLSRKSRFNLIWQKTVRKTPEGWVVPSFMRIKRKSLKFQMPLGPDRQRLKIRPDYSSPSLRLAFTR